MSSVVGAAVLMGRLCQMFLVIYRSCGRGRVSNWLAGQLLLSGRVKEWDYLMWNHTIAKGIKPGGCIHGIKPKRLDTNPESSLNNNI